MPKRKMSKPRKWKAEEPPTVPEAVFSKIAEVMEIPKEKRADFISEVKVLVRISGGLFISKQLLKQHIADDRKTLKKIARAANALHLAVKAPTDSVRKHLGIALWWEAAMAWWKLRGPESFPRKMPWSREQYKALEQFAADRDFDGLRDFDAFVSACDRAATVARRAVAALATGPGALAENEKATPRGRRKGFSNHTAAFLAVGLVDAAEAFGGKCTVSAPAGTGTLVAAQELCLSVLPKGFRIYSPASLKTIKDGWVRRGK